MVHSVNMMRCQVSASKVLSWLFFKFTHFTCFVKTDGQALIVLK